MDDLCSAFEQLDASRYPDFHELDKTLQQALWVLCVAKDVLGKKMLSAEQIATVLRDVFEVSVDRASVTCAFNRAGRRVHRHRPNAEWLYEIMGAGREYLLSGAQKGAVEVFHFEPEKPYTSKRTLGGEILHDLGHELRILDPYCGERTLDVLSGVPQARMMFLTRMTNLREPKRQSFLRDLGDFKVEHPCAEFRDYPHQDIHDRYVIGRNKLLILGHSIKDLGTRQSVAILLTKDVSRTVYAELLAGFDRRWNQSSVI